MTRNGHIGSGIVAGLLAVALVGGILYGGTWLITGHGPGQGMTWQARWTLGAGAVALVGVSLLNKN